MKIVVIKNNNNKSLSDQSTILKPDPIIYKCHMRCNVSTDIVRAFICVSVFKEGTFIT